MTRAVIDTNVFVSAILGGRLAPVLDFWQAGQFTLVVSDEIVREYVEVLRRPKLRLAAAEIDAIASFTLQRAEFVVPLERVAVVAADPPDNKFLEAAAAGAVDLLVSGDHHLLNLGRFRNIPIVTAREFLDQILAQQSPDTPAG